MTMRHISRNSGDDQYISNKNFIEYYGQEYIANIVH